MQPIAHASTFLLLLVPTSVQAQATPGFSTATAIRGGHGVQVTAAGVFGHGDGYRARFESDRVTFTPALGRAVDSEMQLSFEFESARRGDQVFLVSGPPAAREHDGERVTYLHAGGIEERYEVRAEGIYQSFLFPTLPEGEGNLIVRGRIHTDLAPRVAWAPNAQDSSLLFEVPGVGGVRWGTAKGIDADGNRCPGTVRLEGDMLELSLPEAFVTSASYPLLLDPLIDPLIDLASGANADSMPDVAYDSTNDTYLAVWVRSFSAIHSHVYFQRLDSVGAPVGFPSPLSLTPYTYPADLSVASVASSDRFLVVWKERDTAGPGVEQVKAAAVDASTGAFTAIISVSPSTNAQVHPSVGGERTLVDDEAVVVWEEVGVGILGRQVHVPLSGTPSATGPTTAIALDDPLVSGTEHEPSISRSGGNIGYYLVTWRHVSSFGYEDITGRAIDRNLNLLGTGTLTISDSSTPLVDRNVTNDGNGIWWVTAFETVQTAAFGASDVMVRAVRLYGGELVHLTAIVPLAGVAFQHESDPSVALLGNNGQALVSYIDGSARAKARVIDPYTCLDCAPEFDLGQAVSIDSSPSVGTQYAGGGGNEALVVWERSTIFTTDTDIVGARYDGGTSDVVLGEPCGSGGILAMPCSLAGNSNFAPRLLGSQVFAPTFYILSFGSAPVGCGPCVFHPLLNGTEIVLATTTGADALASVTLPIPATAAGIEVTSQWMTLLNGGDCPAFPTVRLSKALRTTLD